ncbi:MAG: hypothetical protein BGP12_05245 [Rhodospirillales bacterium 70-18]|nr:hypothetical protein [Rhodospirillales bacterium]OJY76855.1 MAG: hypothetical protein BGP12_05245 [Rhodospirillales bacterium 70-18]
MTARVHRAPDGELFLAGGNNEVLRLYSTDGFAALVSPTDWQRRLAARDAFFGGLGVPWRMLLAPEKLSVRGDGVVAALLGGGAVPPAARLAAAIGGEALTDPCGYLRAQEAAGHAMFMRTDSHWSPLGAFCGFQWAMAALGLQLDFAPYLELQDHQVEYRGDLWEERFADLPPDRFHRRAVPDWISRVYANPIVRLKERQRREDDVGLHVGCHVAYRNARAERPERLVLCGSSFSDHRAECSLLTFVAAMFFREVHFIWSSDLDLDLIRRIAPDLALVEMPERFLTHCPADRFDLAAHEQAVAGGR